MSATPAEEPVAYAAVFREQERFLRALCYRMTGCAADADDLVQETFVRAIERPPAASATSTPCSRRAS